MNLTLKLIEPIAWLCNRKRFVALAHKKVRSISRQIVKGGGGMNTCNFESPARRLALAKHVACSLLAVAISVCVLPDANAEVIGFQSPYSGSSIYAYQLDGATIQVRDLVNPGKGFLSASISTSDIRFQSAPTGLSVGSLRASSDGDYIYLTFSCTGACRTVSSATSVTIEVKRTAYIGVDTLPATPLWYSEGSFTINPNPKVLVTSTPTNSSTVTEAGSTSTFTVQLGQAPSASVTVAVSSGDSTEGSVSPSTMTFTTQNWSSAQTVTVTGVDDSIQDGNVSWNVVLNPASSGDSTYNGLSNVNVAMTTSDNEGSPSFSINSPSVTEGDTGSVNLTFTVTMSPTSTSQYTVNYADAGTGTATSGTDYTAVTANTLTFAANTTSQTITVSVTGDTISEPNETVVVTLSNASSGSTIGTASGTGTIMDNDTPSFSINSPSVTEGDSGSVNLTFTVSLNPAGASPHTVDYARTGGTATSGTDYTAFSSGRLTFAAGTTSQTITVSVRGDTLDESNETVVLTLSSASSGSTIGTATGTGTITDDDPKFSINSPSMTEGDSGSVNLVFTVTLSAAGATQHTVNYAQTGGTATSGTDYTAVTANTLTFAAGTTSQTITVSVTGDTTDESNETVVITLSNASSGTAIATATGTGTIRDDDPKFSIADASSVTEGDSPANLVFTVSLSAASTAQLTVDYALSGTATSGTDYTAPAGTTLTFAANSTSQTITVPVTDDTLDEVSETVVVTLSNPSAATGISTATGTGTILDNDPQFSINSPTVTEGDSGSVNLDFTVTLSASSTSQLTVDYAQTGGTATSGTDYTAVAASTLTFAAGTTTQTIRVSVTGDTTNEANETVIITLSNATAGAGISTAVGTGTITDNDTPGFSINSPSVTEGDSGSQNMTFTVTLSPASYQATTVDYATTTTGTATVATDFTATSGTLSFAIGETSQTFTVSVAGDTNDEGASETVVVALSNASTGTNIATATGTGTIMDNDPKFSVADASATEGDTGSVNMTFTVTLSGAGNSQYTVDYASSDGTATAGTDYTAVSGTLTFAAGTTSRTLTVSVTGDTANEVNETLTVTLSNPSAGAGIATATGTGTITDNDTPGFSINSPSVDEGDSSTVSLTFTVTLSPAPATQATVNYASSDGTTNGATAGTDYTAVSGTLTFAAGITTQTITVSVSGDTTHEADETVVITLSGASTGTNIATATGTGTITNDDPGLSIDSPSVTEGDSESENLVFTVTLDRASSSSQVTVNWAEGTGGTATSGTDYTAITGGTLTFASSETSKTITVSVTGDTINEADETVIITLSSASGADIVTASGTGTITDNDTPMFSIDSPSVAEGDSSTADLTFTVTLSPASYQPVTVDYAQTGGTATSGIDYTAVTAGTTLTFAAGVTSQPITVSVTGDTVDESNETVVITLSNESTGTDIETAAGTGTIQDDDPKFSIDSPSVTEGDNGSVNLVFTVTLSASSMFRHTVDYADAGTGTATSGTDYTAVTSGTLTFAPGVTSRTIAVSVTGDTAVEANETVVLTLSNASSAGIATASGTGTITDNETPNFSIDSPSVMEGGTGDTPSLTFTVTLNPAPAAPATVNWAVTTDGTATSGTDFAATSGGTLSFAATETSKTFTVSVTGDTTYEPDETVVVTLSSASAGTTIATATGTGTIANDDPGLSIDSPSVAEGDIGSVNLVFTVTLAPSSSSQVTVAYAFGGTATGGTDYATISGGTLTFAANDASETITVSVTGDTDVEADETVIVTLSSPSGAGLATASGTGTIRDDDTPSFSIDSPSVAEGGTGDTGSLTFTVTLNPAPAATATVNYVSSDGTANGATAGTDYTAVSGTLTFAAGIATQTIAVPVTGDAEIEPNETVVLTLSNASTGTRIATAGGTGTILNDDRPAPPVEPAPPDTSSPPDTPDFSIDSPNVTEGDSGSANLVFTVTLNPASSSQVTVNYARTGGTATSGTDYTALVNGTLTFAAGDTNKTITVSVMGDTEFEPDETVVITLSDASTGTRIETARGTGTITDNDTPSFSINSPSVAEGDTGSVNLTFTVTLAPASYEQATVNYADAGTGTATSGTDYATISGGMLTFAADETSKTITVSVTGDTVPEENETVVLVLSNPNPSSYAIEKDRGTGTIENDDDDTAVLDEVDTEIVAEVAREVTTRVVTAVGNRIASVVGSAAIVPPTGGFADGGLLSILERSAQHSRERERGLERSEMSLYRSLDGASFVYTPSVAALGANGSADASGGMLAGTPTVWGSVDYRKLSGGGADSLQWDGELASVNIGTDTMVDSGVLVGLAAGMSKGSFGYQGSTGGTSGVVKVRVKSLNPYIGWSVSESASLWAAVGYGKGKVNYNDGATGEAASKMSIASAGLGGRYRLLSNDSSLCSCLIQVALKGEAWGLQTKVDGDERRPMGSKSRAHGARVAIERLQSSALESGASLTLSGEAGLRWDGGDGDTGAGIEMGGKVDYRNPATRMKVVATGRALLDHESDRKEWGAGLTAGYRLNSRETGLTYSSSVSHGQLESGVDSLWDSRVASRASEDAEPTTRLDAEVGYRMFGSSGLHTPYAGFGVEEGSKRDYRLGMRYASESELSSGLEFERREANGKQPDHRVMLTGQIDW